MFREVANRLKQHHTLTLIYFEKDVISELVHAEPYPVKTFSISSSGKTSFFGAALNFAKKEYELYKIVKERSIDLLVGTSVVIAHIAKLTGARSLIFTEDDIDVIHLSAKIGYPYCDHIVCPLVCKMGKWEEKSIKYDGYQKLAYLHPNVFNNSKENVLNELDLNQPYYLLRFASLTAHHDVGIKGITDQIAEKIIERLTGLGNIYISSERELSSSFEPYRININPIKMHHVLSNAEMLISDSQSMSVEAAMLGVPSLRFSDFAGRISVLEELENKYKLTFGIKTDEPDNLFKQLENLLNFRDYKKEFQLRRDKMLNEKIDVCSFMTDLINNYPESIESYK